jgi:hypothetical protein
MKATNYEHIYREHQADYGRKLTQWAQEHLANRYSERTHFIFELLQNAEDALKKRADTQLPTSVSFHLLDDGLEVRHFGNPFTPENVKSICAINESTKKNDLTEIGCFGIGFKSVYAFTKRPEVHSGDEHFAIEGFVLPIEVPARPTRDGETLFWLPFTPEDTTAVDEISVALTSLGARSLLFLKFVTDIEWSLPTGESGLFLKNPPQDSQGGHRVILLGERNDGSGATAEEWQVFSRIVAKSDGRDAGYVEVAFQIGEGVAGAKSIQTIDESRLVVFFPTEVRTGFGFLIQGPYRTTPSRDIIPTKDTWNHFLVQETSELLVIALRALKSDRLLGVNTLLTLPIDASIYRVGSMLRPLFEKVAAAFTSEDLLPVYGGGHCAGNSIRLARGEGLRELFDSKQLASLVGETGEVFWLSEEITQNKTPILREFLMQHCAVAEITPDSLIPRLSEAFLRQQGDEWTKRLYLFLSGQKAVLRELLKRGTPFIRCEDNSHVPPFRGEVPQAFLPGKTTTGFPTVKASICSDTDALEFLRSLQLSEPDPVDDVIQNVLSHYRSLPINRTDTDYDSDARRIRDAYLTDSDHARRKLVDALKSSFFVHSINAASGAKKFLKPEQVYRSTQRLRDVFAGVGSVWLVDDSIPALTGELARQMLTACGTLDVLRVAAFDGMLTHDERRSLRVKRGAEAFSSDSIEGDAWCGELDDFLGLLPTLPPEDARRRALAFWQLLRDTLRDRREAYFQLRYSWSYYQNRWEVSYPATWVRTLQNRNWIPDDAGHLRRPSELCLSQVAKEIREVPSPFLAEILGFRPEAMKELAEKEGIDLEMLNLLKRHKVSADQLRKFLGESGTDDQDDVSDVDETSEGDGDTDEQECDSGSDIDDEQNEVDSGESGDRGKEGIGSGENKYGQGRGHGGNGSGGDSGKRTPNGARGRQFHTYVSVNANSDPTDDEGLSAEDLKATEAAAIDFIVSLEPHLERTPTNNPGFDLYEGESLEFIVRYVEVKSKKGSWNNAVALSEEQFRLAEIERERFWLYVVENAQNPIQRRLHKIQDPAGKSKYFTFDSGWKLIAAERNFEGERSSEG